MQELRKIARKIVPENWQEFIRVQRIKKEFDTYRFHPAGNNLLKAFDIHQILFVHIPKNAGISLRESLFETSGFSKHVKAITYKYYLGNKTFNAYFKFAFVRNPWARTLSAYLFLQKGGINKPDKKWADNVLTEYPTFEKFVMEGLHRPEVINWVHFIPQYKWICDHKNRNLMDFTGRMETLKEDYETIRAKTGIGKPLVFKNKGAGITDYRERYTPEMLKKVGEVYKTDIGMFNYKF